MADHATRRTALFFSVTFALTWVDWAIIARVWGLASPQAPLITAARSLLFLLGVFAPGIVATAITLHDEGRGGARNLLRGIVRWDVPARWYLFAIGYMVVTKLAVAVVFRLSEHQWPVFGETRPILLLVATITSAWAQAGEEVGWRGFALPRLSDRFGLAPASLLLGVVWALWHLPLFYLPGPDTFHQSFPLYLLQLTAFSVAIAWVYWRTNGSLLLVMLMHAAINNTKDIVPSSSAPGATPLTLDGAITLRLTVIVLWIGAVWLLSQMPWASRSRTTTAPATAAPAP